MQITNGQAWRVLTFALVATQQYQEGIEAGRKGIAFVSDDADLHYATGFALYSTGRLEEALSEIDSTLNLNPYHASAKQLLLACLKDLARQQLTADPLRAEQTLSRLHKLSPADPDVVCMMLSLFQETNAAKSSTSFETWMTP